MSKAKRTKWYIVEKTAEIFNKKGFMGTSLTDLTTATNLTKGSIYGNYKNKEEVAIAAFNHNYQNLIKRFAPKLSAEKSAKGKLLAFLNTYEEAFPDIMQQGGCPIANNAVDADDTNNNLNDLSVKAFNDWNKKISAIISQGKSTYEIQNTIDANFYADLFIVTIEGGLLISKSTGQKHYFNHAIQHLKAVIENEL
jgi:AcrR family transcriptional regulator